MEKPQDLEQYWTARYNNQTTGWDLGAVSAPIKEYVSQLQHKELSILIPGAGNAYEAEYLYRSGFLNTSLIDISSVPLENFMQRLPEFPEEQAIQGDFFSLQGQFDLIIEQTFFCSFPPVDGFRKRYAKKMHDLLKPGGKLVGLWFDIPPTDDMDKRPFGGSREEYVALFTDLFEVKTFERAYNSMSDRAGKELFAILVKR